jgi:hypothetical protein
MGLQKRLPKDRRLSLKRRKVSNYFKVLEAVYQLREEKHFAINWRLLSQYTQIDEGDACDAALDLRVNGFFDTKTQEMSVSLTPEQFERGLSRSRRILSWALFKRTVTWQVLATAFGVIAWFGIIPNLIVGQASNFLENFKKKLFG